MESFSESREVWVRFSEREGFFVVVDNPKIRQLHREATAALRQYSATSEEFGRKHFMKTAQDKIEQARALDDKSN